MSTTTRFCLFVVLLSLLVLSLQAARVDRVYEMGSEGRNKDLKGSETVTDAKKSSGNINEEERLQSMKDKNRRDDGRRFHIHETENDWTSAEETVIPQQIRDQFEAIDDAQDRGIEDSRYYGCRCQRDGRSRGSRGKTQHRANDSDFKTLGRLLWKIKSGLIRWLQKIVELE